MNWAAFWATWCLGLVVVLPLGFRCGWLMAARGGPLRHGAVWAFAVLGGTGVCALAASAGWLIT